jgi:hypothetical protein
MEGNGEWKMENGNEFLGVGFWKRNLVSDGWLPSAAFLLLAARDCPLKTTD